MSRYFCCTNNVKIHILFANRERNKFERINATNISTIMGAPMLAGIISVLCIVLLCCESCETHNSENYRFKNGKKKMKINNRRNVFSLTYPRKRNRRKALGARGRGGVFTIRGENCVCTTGSYAAAALRFLLFLF